MNHTIPRANPSPHRHDGPCGRRAECWRPVCAEAQRGYQTVEILDSGRVIAFCHGASFDGRSFTAATPVVAKVTPR